VVELVEDGIGTGTVGGLKETTVAHHGPRVVDRSGAGSRGRRTASRDVLAATGIIALEGNA
jgi:hypothetical protein